MAIQDPGENVVCECGSGEMNNYVDSDVSLNMSELHLLLCFLV